MEQKTALVTAIGSVAGDIVIKNLKKLGFRVIGCDIYAKEWLADAWAVDAFYQAPYATDTENYLGFMLELCRTESIDYILPLIGREGNYHTFEIRWYTPYLRENIQERVQAKLAENNVL